MNEVPFWMVGLSLALVALLHWWLTGRMLAVSGRLTATVNRLREGPASSASDLTGAELLEVALAATRAEFGEEAIRTAEALARTDESHDVAVPPPQPVGTHFLFFSGLAAGGLLSSLLRFDVGWTVGLHSEGFSARFGNGPLAWLALAGGGLLVGFGTRMAGGCTSGHGLCGVSRFQAGSLIATGIFFATGIAVSFLLGGGA
jgi:uncharacterized membrane protein YedE/YeeE